MSTACRYADKFLGQLAQKYPGIALFFVETDYDEALLDLEEISFLPTIIVKLNGQVFKKLVGKLEGHENDLIAELSQVLGK